MFSAEYRGRYGRVVSTDTDLCLVRFDHDGIDHACWLTPGHPGPHRCADGITAGGPVDGETWPT
jgi:hypothetical protein